MPHRNYPTIEVSVAYPKTGARKSLRSFSSCILDVSLIIGEFVRQIHTCDRRESCAAVRFGMAEELLLAPPGVHLRGMPRLWRPAVISQQKNELATLDKKLSAPTI